MSMSKDDDDRLDEEALAWIARETSGEFTDRERVSLRTWLAQSDRHLRAYAEARALWQDMEGLRGRPVVSDLLLSLDQAQAARGHRRRRPVVAMSLAASVLLSLLLLGLHPVLWADHATSAGERRSVSLPDGSTVHLNSQSALSLDYTETERGIELIEGEAEFEVSPDPRPFVVEAGPARIQALGTDFWSGSRPRRSRSRSSRTPLRSNIQTHTLPEPSPRAERSAATSTGSAR